jgi:hypothetical protein
MKKVFGQCPCYPAWVRIFGKFIAEDNCAFCKNKLSETPTCEYAIVFGCSCVVNSVHLFPSTIHVACTRALLKLTNPSKNPVLVFPFLTRTLDKDLMQEARDVFFKSNECVVSICIRCGEEGNALTCWKCQKVCYCSNVCRTKDARVHKLICSTL